MRPTAPLALAMTLALTACTGGAGSQEESRPPPSAAPTTPDGVTPARESLPCPAAVQRELVGTRHGIVGHSFVWPEPFRSPPLRDRHNKILWELQRPGRA